MLDNQKHLIKLHDTAGQEDYERLRQVIYKDVRNNLIQYYGVYNLGDWAGEGGGEGNDVWCYHFDPTANLSNLSFCVHFIGRLFHIVLQQGWPHLVWEYSQQMVSRTWTVWTANCACG